MKLQELKALVREVIAEELANDGVNKKKVAIAEIKRIIAENEIEETELEEIFGFGKTEPATDAELDKWLSGSPAVKASLAKMDAEKAGKWREFVKKNFAKNIRKGETIMNVKWDDTKKEFTTTQAPSGGGKLGFSQ